MDWKDIVIILLIAEHVWAWATGRGWWFGSRLENWRWVSGDKERANDQTTRTAKT